MRNLKLQILASLLAGLALTGCDDAPSGSSGAADAETVSRSDKTRSRAPPRIAWSARIAPRSAIGASRP